MGPARRSEVDAHGGAINNGAPGGAGSVGRSRGHIMQGCERCKTLPAAGDKLRACGGCLVSKYCSATCQREAWTEHRLVCKSQRDQHEKVLAELEEKTGEPGSGQRTLERASKAVEHWFITLPGLTSKVQFLAWKHRAESPVIHVSTPTNSLDSVPEVNVVPRSAWDGVFFKNHLGDNDVVTGARTFFSRSDFRVDKTFLLYIAIDSVLSGPSCNGFFMRVFESFIPDINSQALKTLTADEFAIEVVRRRKDRDAVYVRLTGLRGAAHLNSREGVLEGPDPTNSERFTVRLEGTKVSVKSDNYELVRRPKLLNAEYEDEILGYTD